MATEERVTYCRICEPLCGLVATVQDGELVALAPDRDHPLSKGFACPKGIAMTEIQNDPDRVIHPLRRRADGSFERVTWQAALDDIGTRLRGVIDRHGGGSIGWYVGNPSAFSYSHPIWVKGFMDALSLAPRVQRRVAGRQQSLRRERAAVRLAGRRPDPRPRVAPSCC